jgi:hypothetical protein
VISFIGTVPEGSVLSSTFRLMSTRNACARSKARDARLRKFSRKDVDF